MLTIATNQLIGTTRFTLTLKMGCSAAQIKIPASLPEQRLRPSQPLRDELSIESIQGNSSPTNVFVPIIDSFAKIVRMWITGKVFQPMSAETGHSHLSDLIGGRAVGVQSTARWFVANLWSRLTHCLSGTKQSNCPFSSETEILPAPSTAVPPLTASSGSLCSHVSEPSLTLTAARNASSGFASG